MKNIIKNLEEAKKQMAIMAEMESRFKSLKKQCLAHEIFEVLKSSNFEEVRFLGEVSSRSNYTSLDYGFYFDAKNKNEDYTGVSLHQTYQQEFELYQERIELSFNAGDDFFALSQLQSIVESFMYREPQLKDEILIELNDQTFGVDFDSILSALMSESEFSNYVVIREKDRLEELVDTAPTVMHSKK